MSPRYGLKMSMRGRDWGLRAVRRKMGKTGGLRVGMHQNQPSTPETWKCIQVEYRLASTTKVSGPQKDPSKVSSQRDIFTDLHSFFDKFTDRIMIFRKCS